jgi:hypothetical protein
MDDSGGRLTDLVAHIDELTIQISNLPEGPRRKKLLSGVADIRVRFGLPALVQEPSLAASTACPADNAPSAHPHKVVNAHTA